MNIEYTVLRSPRRRKLTITVERDRRVVVHAPESTSEAKIHEVVQSKRQWIYAKTRHGQKYSEQPHAPGKEMVSGESALYLGRRYRIEVVDMPLANEVVFDRKFLISQADSDAGRAALTAWYRQRAREVILPRVNRRAKELGVDYQEAKISESRYRWGSCTIKDNVNFNWRLIKAPMFVVDYVIVHELAHLLEPNHSPRFWNIVKTQSPQMEKARSWLQEHGQLLEEEI